MAQIIQFKTRTELEREKQEQLLKEWHEYLEWEKATMRKAKEEQNETNLVRQS